MQASLGVNFTGSAVPLVTAKQLWAKHALASALPPKAAYANTPAASSVQRASRWTPPGNFCEYSIMIGGRGGAGVTDRERVPQRHQQPLQLLEQRRRGAAAGARGVRPGRPHRPSPRRPAPRVRAPAACRVAPLCPCFHPSCRPLPGALRVRTLVRHLNNFLPLLDEYLLSKIVSYLPHPI